jgi:SOS-response transcriptional repressor LexA
MGGIWKKGVQVMETREAILDFQYSEKMKSGLIIGIGLLDQLMSLKKDEELSGGQKVLIWYLEGLLRELRIAENVLGFGHYSELERKVMEVIGRVQVSQFQEAQRSFSEAISLATTSCQASMTFLMENKLV